MSESTAVAESSSAPVQESIELPRSGTSEYAQWRISGELPEKPKETQQKPVIEEAATSQVEEGESATPRQQEKVLSPAEKRIKELLAENKRLKAESETAKTPKPEPSSESKPQLVPQTRPKPTPEDKNDDGTPKYKSYEDYVEELADWKAEQRMAVAERERSARDQQRALQAEVEKARGRYDNLDEVMLPALKTITEAQVAPVIMQMLDDSEVLPDLLYTLGSDADDLAAFLKMAKSNPGKAIRYLAVTENLIQEELGKADVPRGTTPSRAADGKFTVAEPEPKTPAKRGPESSPELPLEVGNRGTGAQDESSRALSDLMKGTNTAAATRAFFKAENAKDLRRRRGA